MFTRFSLLLMLATLIQTTPTLAMGDGDIDPNYGSIFGRTVINTFPGLVGDTPALSALAESASGRTWLFGSAGHQTPDNTLLIARLMADSGQLDPGFGSGSGKVRTTLPASVTSIGIKSAIVQADGKPIVAGNWRQNGDVRGFVCRLNVAGNLDANYASGGCRVLRAFLYTNELCGVVNIAADPADLSLIVAGSCTNEDTPAQQRPFLARLTNVGALDVGFGAGVGVTTPTLSGGELRSISAVAIQPGGRFVGIGNNLRGTGDYDISAMQFSNDGTLDPGFGGGGVFTITPDIAGNKNDFAGDIAARPDGRILMLGLAEGAGKNGVIVLQQLTALGTNDSGFGNNGRFLAPATLDQTFALDGINAFLSARPRLAVDDLGRAVVLARNGLALNQNATNARVYRFTAAGGTDPNFGDTQSGFVDITNEVAVGGTGDLSDAPKGLVVNRTRILLGMISSRANTPDYNMLTLTLQADSLFANGFE